MVKTTREDHKALGRSKVEAGRRVTAREYDVMMAAAEVKEAEMAMKDTQRMGRSHAKLAKERLAAADWQAAARPLRRQEACCKEELSQMAQMVQVALSREICLHPPMTGESSEQLDDPCVVA